MASIQLIIESEKKQRLLRLTRNVSNGTFILYSKCRLTELNTVDFTPQEISTLLGDSYEGEYLKLNDHKNELLNEASTVSILRNHLTEGTREINAYTDRLQKMIQLKKRTLPIDSSEYKRNVQNTLSFLSSRKDTVMGYLNELETAIEHSISA